MAKTQKLHDSNETGSAASPLLGLTPYGQQNTMYLLEPNGAGNIVSLNDINQGGLNDCYLLASMGEVAREAIYLGNPALISSMIKVNSNGTETVKLYEDANGKFASWLTTALKPVYETVTNVFAANSVNSGQTQDVVGNVKEIWPEVIEKADAQLHGGYAAFTNGGNAYLAMEELTGHLATWMSPNVTLSQLNAMVSAHDLLVFDTSATGVLPAGLINWHSYMFEGTTGSGAATVAHFGNPWGFDQPAPILVSQLSSAFSGLNVGHLT